MPLDKQQVKVLVSAVADTREDEINCDECLAGWRSSRSASSSVPRFAKR